jgi:hypothetical protein
MSDVPEHIKWLTDTKEHLTTADGKIVEVWEFRHQPDDKVLSAWAKHFRNHYCSDEEIDYFRKDTGCSRAEFLSKIKFPDAKKAPGPSIRAGDFGEILVADFLESILGFWVPRARYGAKVVNNESSKGCDTIGFLFAKEGEESPKDKMAIFETKARLTTDHLTTDDKASGFQSAINDSAKDEIRKACSLNYLKQQLYYQKKYDEADRVGRFQNSQDHPYKELYGAAGVFSDESYILKTITEANAETHPGRVSLRLIVIRGPKLMDLVCELYKRAADEA